MKALLAAAAAITLIPIAALAQSHAEREVLQERHVIVSGPGMHMQIDADGLTREEFLARHTEMFARMDANGDGRVMADEMQAHHRAMMAEHGGPMRMHHGEGGPEGHGGMTMMHHQEAGADGHTRMMIQMHGDGPGLDADGDGRIAFDELAAPLRRHFDEMDADDSGFLESGEHGPAMVHRGH